MSATTIIRVLIVDDSPVMLQLLTYAVSTDPMLVVIGVAHNGEEAIDAVRRYHPDVIAMDWQMPKLDGVQATRIIMETIPTPIVIVTGNDSAKNAAVSFQMMEAGALAVLLKPHSVDHPDFKKDVVNLTQTLKLMSEVKLVKRMSRAPKKKKETLSAFENQGRDGSDIELVAIGASTGGPMVLQKILSGLPEIVPVPVVIVQHNSLGFVEGFVEWLQLTSKIPLHIAVQGELLLPGHGYIAPDNFQMGIAKGPRIELSDEEMEFGLRPSVSYLFRSVANVIGAGAVGILLTGMGRDGADELNRMKDHGAITIAQDKNSSIIHGMPGEAIRLNAAMYVLSPEKIITTLIFLFQGKTKVIEEY
jgi:two-component system chemotaxis response regulator CheB